MKKCKYCLYREGCIGEIPGPDGKCMGFAVPPELQQAYQAFMEEEKTCIGPRCLRPNHRKEIDYGQA